MSVESKLKKELEEHVDDILEYGALVVDAGLTSEEAAKWAKEFTDCFEQGELDETKTRH